MGFNVKFKNKDGIVLDWPQLDKEVCELWGIEPDDDHWATPPGKDHAHNWHEFLGRAVMLTRAFKETGTFLPSDLLRGLCSFGDLYPHLDRIEKYKYEIHDILLDKTRIHDNSDKPMVEKKKIVFFTGAGMSKESGLPTFRGDGGMWNEIDYDKVATRKSWNSRGVGNVKERRQAMLDFFNPLRRMILKHEPNVGHLIIADIENGCDVTVITQNGDDYHTQAGSTNVIYLHGEALKNASSANPSLSYPIDFANPDIHIGDKAPDGSQLRPFVIYFDEDIDKNLWNKAVKATKEADWFVVVGSTMLVYPAASLLAHIKRDCHIVVIDPSEDVELPKECDHGFIHIPEAASVGLWHFREMLAIYERKNRYLKQFYPDTNISWRYPYRPR